MRKISLIILTIIIFFTTQSVAQNMILGGELSNSAATNIADIDSAISRVAKTDLNTVLVPAQWDLIEPNEGTFDFLLIDETIKIARQHNIKIIFLWFGAWKNSMSCYAPMWFKENTTRFPRATTENGKQMEIASAFSENVFKADNNGLCTLMKHIHQIDTDKKTVIMIQLENEIGMLESARDHSPIADNAYKGKDWRKYLKGNEDKLQQDEIFQAVYYARYVERLAKNIKKIHDIPLYVNAAMNSRGRKPGEYPSAGPLAHLQNVWKVEAPDIDIMAPDIYDVGFKNWASQYAFKGNPLFIPESKCCENSGVRALYSFGELDAIGFSPFAIDIADSKSIESIKNSYALLKKLQPLLKTYKGTDDMHGILLDQYDKECKIEYDNTVLTCRHYYTLPWDSRASDGSTWQESGAIIIRIDKNDYIIAGNGIVITFKTKDEKKQEINVKLGEDGFAEKENINHAEAKKFYGKRMGIGFIDQIDINKNGHFSYIRRDNGDQSHQGRHACIQCGEYRILHVKLYEY